MAQRGNAGGILGLLELLDEHQEAVERELIELGLRLRWLGTDRLSWRDLLVVVRQSPPGSPIDRAMNPDHMWGLPEQLAASIVDSLRIANWMQTEDGSKNRNQPKPLPRPGVVDPDQTIFGEGPLPIDELDEFLGWTPPQLTIVA